jgi:hypothetical protein
LCQMATNCAFTCAHRAYQKNIAFFSHFVYV